MRALVIEDEPRIASFIEFGLTAEGFTVEVADNGADGLCLAESAGFDVIVLDLMLPRVSGEEVLHRLRAGGSTVPVVVLTAKDAVLDRVTTLNAGADDYLVKPFSFAELLARIRARLRSAPAATDPTVLTVGRIRIDLARRRCWTGDRSVELTNREFRLLEVFMRHPGHVLSHAQLLDLAWGYAHDPGSNIVEVYISYLRKKVGADTIETVRGGGYRFVDRSA
ncbi:response regulator transcription factor [Hoyosella sp. YIM 151337]|uniref:response regulator transcription factor n=1 Tax=Hoyosella sp. YIM 151337 TaxID=2992742 RepID=UPI002434F043|nr:response regulator transcription factor [Hoyosella sp. YIM 151337]